MSQDRIKRDEKGRFTKGSYFAYFQGKTFSENHKKKLSDHARKQRGIKKDLTEEQYKKYCSYLEPVHKAHIGTHPSEEMKQRIKNSNLEHNEECAKLKKKLEHQGFKAIDTHVLKPDVIATKDGKIYAYEIEFGNPEYSKYNQCSFFDDIIWVLKSRKKNYTVIRSNNGAKLSQQLPA